MKSGKERIAKSKKKVTIVMPEDLYEELCVMQDEMCVSTFGQLMCEIGREALRIGREIGVARGFGLRLGLESPGSKDVLRGVSNSRSGDVVTKPIEPIYDEPVEGPKMTPKERKQYTEACMKYVDYLEIKNQWGGELPNEYQKNEFAAAKEAVFAFQAKFDLPDDNYLREVA